MFYTHDCMSVEGEHGSPELNPLEEILLISVLPELLQGGYKK